MKLVTWSLLFSSIVSAETFALHAVAPKTYPLPHKHIKLRNNRIVLSDQGDNLVSKVDNNIWTVAHDDFYVTEDKQTGVLILSPYSTSTCYQQKNCGPEISFLGDNLLFGKTRLFFADFDSFTGEYFVSTRSKGKNCIPIRLVPEFSPDEQPTSAALSTDIQTTSFNSLPTALNPSATASSGEDEFGGSNSESGALSFASRHTNPLNSATGSFNISLTPTFASTSAQNFTISHATGEPSRSTSVHSSFSTKACEETPEPPHPAPQENSPGLYPFPFPQYPQPPLPFSPAPLPFPGNGHPLYPPLPFYPGYPPSYPPPGYGLPPPYGVSPGPSFPLDPTFGQIPRPVQPCEDKHSSGVVNNTSTRTNSEQTAISSHISNSTLSSVLSKTSESSWFTETGDSTQQLHSSRATLYASESPKTSETSATVTISYASGEDSFGGTATATGGLSISYPPSVTSLLPIPSFAESAAPALNGTESTVAATSAVPSLNSSVTATYEQPSAWLQTVTIHSETTLIKSFASSSASATPLLSNWCPIGCMPIPNWPGHLTETQYTKSSVVTATAAYPTTAGNETVDCNTSHFDWEQTSTFIESLASSIPTVPELTSASSLTLTESPAYPTPTVDTTNSFATNNGTIVCHTSHFDWQQTVTAKEPEISTTSWVSSDLVSSSQIYTLSSEYASIHEAAKTMMIHSEPALTIALSTANSIIGEPSGITLSSQSSATTSLNTLIFTSVNVPSETSLFTGYSDLTYHQGEPTGHGGQWETRVANSTFEKSFSTGASTAVDTVTNSIPLPTTVTEVFTIPIESSSVAVNSDTATNSIPLPATVTEVFTIPIESSSASVNSGMVTNSIPLPATVTEVFTIPIESSSMAVNSSVTFSIETVPYNTSTALSSSMLFTPKITQSLLPLTLTEVFTVLEPQFETESSRETLSYQMSTRTKDITVTEIPVPTDSLSNSIELLTLTQVFTQWEDVSESLHTASAMPLTEEYLAAELPTSTNVLQSAMTDASISRTIMTPQPAVNATTLPESKQFKMLAEESKVLPFEGGASTLTGSKTLVTMIVGFIIMWM